MKSSWNGFATGFNGGVASAAVAALVSSWSAPGLADEVSSTPAEGEKPSAAAALRPRVQPPIFARFTYNAPGDTEGDLDASIDSVTAEAAVVVPLYRGETASLLFGTGYRYDRFQIDPKNVELVRVQDGLTLNLHRIPANVMVDLRLSDSWAALVSAGAVFAGDFKDSDGDAVQPSALAMATYAFNDRHAVTLGAGLSRQFFDLTPFPVLGYAYLSESKSLRLDALLPLSARATLSVGWDLDISLDGRFEGLVWQVAAAPTDVNYL